MQRMAYRLLLVNPWIYDFAAYNLWARPLGLLKVGAFLSQFNTELRLIDCTAGYKTQRRYSTGPYQKTPVEKPDICREIPRTYSRYGILIDDFTAQVKAALPVDAVFITSIMTYWYEGIAKAVEILRELTPHSPIILGGIYATLYPDHAERVITPDYLHKGHIDDNFSAISIGKRLKRVNVSQPYYRLNLYREFPFAPILTSSGCPFTCPYCATPLLNREFYQRPAHEILEEISDLRSLGVLNVAFYDDALLVNADRHIKPILRRIIDKGIGIRFHCPNGLHARYIDDDLASLMKSAGFTTLRLSLETINRDRQVATGDKICSPEFERAVSILKGRGFDKTAIGAYLMYGLPGQRLAEVREGVEFLKGLGVRIHLTEFSPIPGTPYFERLVDMGIIREGIDPLLTNNSIFSYLFSGYDPEELAILKRDVTDYNNADL